jgi:serine/threonine protein kinase
MVELYTNNIIFPSHFTNVYAKNLISQLININPNERLSIESIKNNDFFSNIDWKEMIKTK